MTSDTTSDMASDVARRSESAPRLRPLLRPDAEPVLFVSGCEGATRRYRCLHQAEQLRLRGIPVRVVCQSAHDIVDEGLGHTFVILHRVAWDIRVQELIDRTREAGGLVLFDIDDLVFEPESTHHHHGVTHLPPDEQALYHDGVRRYRRTLLACDGALVPTRFLADRIRALGRPAWISRNCIDLEIVRRSALAAAGTGRGGAAAGRAGDATEGAGSAIGRERSATGPAESATGGGLVIGYASGSRTHDLDFAEAAGPAVLRIMSRRPDVRFRVVGPLSLGPEWAGFADRIELVPAVDWRALPAEIARFDISLAPLEIDNPFCRAKSELKWLEASACGVPSVAVATDAFRDAIRDGETGRLAADVGGWERALEELIDDPDMRRAMGEAAASEVRQHRATEGQALSFERTLTEARAALRPDTVAPQSPALLQDGRPDRGLAVTMLVPEPPKGSGGHASIFRMIAALESAGHDVTVHIKPGPLMQGEREAEAAAFIRANFPRSGAHITLDPEIGPCDVVIATSWTTALDAHFAPATTKLYFVQDFEPFFQSLSADYLASESTYRLGLGHITLGPWLAELLSERYDARAVPIDFGVEHEIYGPGAGEAEVGVIAEVGGTSGSAAIEGSALIPVIGSSDGPRVVFYGRGSTPRRGVTLGLEALALVKAARPDVEVVLYGGDAPGLADFTYVDAGILTQPELAALYRSATVGLALSYTNLSFVPLEMAACGLPVVAVETEPAAWYQVDGVTCHVAAPTAESVAAGILCVIDDPNLRRRLIQGGLRRVAELSWEISTAQFVRHVEDYVADEGEGGSRGDVDPTPPALRPVLDILDDGGDRSGNESTSAASALTLQRGNSIEWTLTPGAGGLHRIDVRLTADRAASKGHLRLSLHDLGENGAIHADSIRSAHTVLDGEWNTFEFPPLAESAGRAYRARIEILKAEPECRVIIAIGGRGVPAHRAFGLDGALEVEGRAAAIHDPGLFERLHHRRRSLAFHRARYSRIRRRRGLMAGIGLWRRWFDPLPPGPHRPWPDSALGGEKALRGVLRYGPIRVMREIAALRRWRSGQRGVSRAAEDLVGDASDHVGASAAFDLISKAVGDSDEPLDDARSPLILDDAPALGRYPMGDAFVLAERALRSSERPVGALGPWLTRWVVARHGVQHVVEVPFPIDHALFRLEPEDGHRDPVVALDLGTCPQRSNAVMGLRALESVARTVAGVRCVVFSSRPLEAEPDLGAGAAAAGVRWIGILEREGRAEFMRKAAVLIVPTFSNPPLEMFEAMACGVMIAAPDVISNTWILENGRTGITAAPHSDAMALSVERALRDPELGRRIADGARASVAGMTIGAAAEAWRRASAGDRPNECPTPPPWLALRPSEPPGARPILHALRFAEERNAALELAVRALEGSVPARAETWLSLRPGPLPPPHARPWPQDANAFIKLVKTFRHYGPAAFAREIRDGVRWWRTHRR